MVISGTYVGLNPVSAAYFPSDFGMLLNLIESKFLIYEKYQYYLGLRIVMKIQKRVYKAFAWHLIRNRDHYAIIVLLHMDGGKLITTTH